MNRHSKPGVPSDQRPKVPAAIRNELKRLEASLASMTGPPTPRRAYAAGALAMARWCLSSKFKRPSELILSQIEVDRAGDE
jgi:hypothetical protein